MKILSFLKNSLTYALGFLVFFGGVQAAQINRSDFLESIKDQPKVFIKSVGLARLKVSFTDKSDKDSLDVRVDSPLDFAVFEHLEAVVKSPNNNTLYTQKLIPQNLKQKVDKNLQWYSFSVRVPTVGFTSDSYIEITGVSKGQKLAFGKSSLPDLGYDLNYELKDLKIVSEDKRQFGFQASFENFTKSSTSIVAQVKVFDRRLPKESQLIMRTILKPQRVEPSSTTQIKGLFESPQRPGIYTFELIVVEAKKKIVSGSLERPFLVEGVFGSFVEASVEIEKDQKPGEEHSKIDLGGYLSSPDPKVRVHIKQTQAFGKGEEVVVVEKQQPVEVVYDGFENTFITDLQPRTSKVKTEIELRYEGEVLDVKTFEQDFNPILPPTKTEAIVEKVKASSSKIWWILGGVIIILLIFFIVRSRSKRDILSCFLGLIFLSSGALASPPSSFNNHSLAAFWYTPTVANPYNPSDDTGFEQVRFFGNIVNFTTGQGLFFGQDPTRMVFNFYKSQEVDSSGGALNVTSCVACHFVELTPDSFGISEGKIYDANIDSSLMPPTLVEGSWKTQLWFEVGGVWYVVNWNNIEWDSVQKRFLTDDNTSIVMDKTPPALTNITYDGVVYTPDEALVNTLVEAEFAGDEGLAAKLQAREQMHLERREKTLLKKAKKNIIREKNALRNHKIALIREKEILLESLPFGEVEENIRSALDLEISALVDQVNALTHNPETIGGGETIVIGDDNSGGDPPPQIPDEQKGINDLLAEIGEGLEALGEPEAYSGDLENLDTLASVENNISASPGTIENDFVQIDNAITALEAEINTKESEVRTIKQRHKNSDIVLGFDCNDPLSGCVESSMRVSVRGNFCSDSTYCNTSGLKDFEICDKVNNCHTLEADSLGADTITDLDLGVDWFDPASPELSSSAIVFNSGESNEVVLSGSGNNLAASSRVPIRLTAQDPNADHTTDPTLFDANICEQSGGDFFYASQDDKCKMSKASCIANGERGEVDVTSGGSCSPCPAGQLRQADGTCRNLCDFFLFDGCFPFVLIDTSCVDTVWLPATSNFGQGILFVQTSNCGKLRQAVGTSL